MQMRMWMAVALLATVTSVQADNRYSYYGPKKAKKKPALTAPALTAATRPATYTQTHDEPSPVAAAPQTYTQTHSPGPNSGKAANGTWTPGGASILSTGPLYYPFSFQGGYAPITLAPIVGGGYQYDPYAGNPNPGCQPPPPQCAPPCPPPAPPAPVFKGLPPVSPAVPSASR